MAKGEISREQIEWFLNEDTKISSRTGFQFNNKEYFYDKGQITKIALMHHPPFYKYPIQDFYLKGEMDIVSNGGQLFLDSISPKVDIIMSGHQHKAFYEEKYNLSSAGTISEWDRKNNIWSFNIVEFNEKEIKIEVYRFIYGRFRFSGEIYKL